MKNAAKSDAKARQPSTVVLHVRVSPELAATVREYASNRAKLNINQFLQQAIENHLARLTNCKLKKERGIDDLCEMLKTSIEVARECGQALSRIEAGMKKSELVQAMVAREMGVQIS